MKPNRCGKYLPLDHACGRDDGHRGPCGDPWKPWKRANYIPSPHYLSLNQACAFINKALDGFGCYLVGSAHERRDYRDVDVRFIMGDAAYDRMFRNEYGWLNPLWSLMCTTISLWLCQQTSLPIDFQIQRQTEANAKHDGKRSALGIFVDYPTPVDDESHFPAAIIIRSDSGLDVLALSAPEGEGTDV